VQNNGDVEEQRPFLNGSLEAALRQLFVRADGTPLEFEGKETVDFIAG
jgi:hypothetical protein